MVDAIARAEAVSGVRGSEDFASISIAFKRIKNILRQASEADKAIAEALRRQLEADQAVADVFRREEEADQALADAGRREQKANESMAHLLEAEMKLAALIPETAVAVRRLREQKDYAPALAEISRLRQPVDMFFDKVMVMVDDERDRTRRLALLQALLSGILHHRRLQ